ncbi:MAG TPA: hypothetical protein VI540_07260 [Gaiellaceae bacterium]|nr:hypothetical protein [Gaiellaceae bacterium]
MHDIGRGFRWETSPAVWSSVACSIAGRVLTEDEWERFLPGRPYTPACT